MVWFDRNRNSEEFILRVLDFPKEKTLCKDHEDQYKTNHSNDSINFHSIRELYTNIDTERRRWEKEVKQYQENEKKNQFQSDLDKFKKHLG